MAFLAQENDFSSSMEEISDGLEVLFDFLAARIVYLEFSFFGYIFVGRGVPMRRENDDGADR